MAYHSLLLTRDVLPALSPLVRVLPGAASAAAFAADFHQASD
jgi:hypothetical protein